MGTQPAKHWLSLARGLLEQPTAAVREDLPQAHIRAFAAARRNLILTEDPSGNLLVKSPARGAARRPPLVLVAHLDHPGFWIDGVSGKTARLTFKGYVAEPHARAGTRIHFFERGNALPAGEGELVSAAYKDKRLVSARARVLRGAAPAGGFAMWAFPGFSIRNGLIVTRCCDDLLGAAAALCTLDEIARRRPRGVALWCLFTRAEEIGFLGAIEALRHRTIPRDACVLSLECSKALPVAPQGGGVIVRVGDRTSIFDTGLSEALRQAAESVRKEHPGTFKYQRKLMDGGTCEATVFCAHGFRSSGVAVPLGNYHNQAFDGKGRAQIGPESVNAVDFVNEVQLLVQLALRPELLSRAGRKKPAWLIEREKAAPQELNSRIARRPPARKHDV